MSNLLQSATDESSSDDGTARRQAPGGSGNALARVGHLLGTQHLWVMRRVAGHEAFQIVATLSPTVIAPGAMLPLSASDLASMALSGVLTSVHLSRSHAPLEALVRASGLETATALPIHDGDRDEVAGAVLAAWSAMPTSAEAAEWAVDRERDELLRLVRRPSGPDRHVAIAHDDPLVAHGLAGITSERLGARVSRCSSVEALLDLTANDQVDLIACDDALGGEPLSETAYLLRAGGAAAPIVAIADTRTSASVADALRAGVLGYVSLRDATDGIVDTLAAALEGRVSLPPAPADPPAPELTHRETDVLRGFERGLSDYAISRELQVSLSTVKTHARRLFRKLEVGSRTAAVHRARSEGLLR